MSKAFASQADLDAAMKGQWGLISCAPFFCNPMIAERAKAAGAAVEVDLADIKPGEKKTVEWRGKPVWVVRRTAEQLAANTDHAGVEEDQWRHVGTIVRGIEQRRLNAHAVA